MFSSIKTSRANKDRVTQLTQRLNLGAENVIARLAFSYSLGQDRVMDLTQMEDAQGKEYSAKVLFGDHADLYIALVCVQYQIYKTDKNIARYIKMHIDDGLVLIEKEITGKDSLTGSDFLINAIESIH